ncbi:MAG: hypothetical protein R6V58_06805, partial [Planctomycetota bacterium]
FCTSIINRSPIDQIYGGIGKRFTIRAELARRLVAVRSTNCPRCRRCQLKAKREAARAIRAHHLFLQRREEVRAADDLLRFSRRR